MAECLNAEMWYAHLVRLYPQDVRFAYEDDMVRDYGMRLAEVRGRARRVAFVLKELLLLVCDVAAERINALYSHRSFHGPCEPNSGVVRPPNMGKAEWFGRMTYDESHPQRPDRS